MKKLLTAAMSLGVIVMLAVPAMPAQAAVGDAFVTSPIDPPIATLGCFPCAAGTVTALHGSVISVPGLVTSAVTTAGITYAEPGCQSGTTTGTSTLTIGTVTWDLTYSRTGPEALITLSHPSAGSATAVVTAVVVFVPQATPERLAARCTLGIGATTPMDVEFYGAGVQTVA